MPIWSGSAGTGQVRDLKFGRNGQVRAESGLVRGCRRLRSAGTGLVRGLASWIRGSYSILYELGFEVIALLSGVGPAGVSQTATPSDL